jgi:esterase/lipase superfamily enzyme
MNFFITNREILTAFETNEEFIREDGLEKAGDNLRFGTYDLTTKKFNLFPEPDNDEALIYGRLKNRPSVELKGSSRFFKEMYDLLMQPEPGKTSKNKEKADVLFFIHGFNTDLEGVRSNFLTLNEKYVDNPESPVKHVVIFTWPGRAPKIPFHYHDDKKDAIRSGEALARGIEKLKDFLSEFLVKAKNDACHRRIHLMVHSMGHRVLKHMLLQLKMIPELFYEILLIAADIEYDIFDKGNVYYNALDLGNRIHIYYHEKDHALGISKFTKNFNNRLGQYGRKIIDPGLHDVFDINVSHTTDDPGTSLREDSINHWYYYTCTPVVEDIINVLNGDPSRI